MRNITRTRKDKGRGTHKLRLTPPILHTDPPTIMSSPSGGIKRRPSAGQRVKAVPKTPASQNKSPAAASKRSKQQARPQPVAAKSASETPLERLPSASLPTPARTSSAHRARSVPLPSSSVGDAASSSRNTGKRPALERELNYEEDEPSHANQRRRVDEDENEEEKINMHDPVG